MTYLQGGICCVVLGGLTLVNWWFHMFSDSFYAQLGRDLGRRQHWMGRNTFSLVEPAGGFMLLLGGIGGLLEMSSSKWVYGVGFGFIMLALLAMIVFALALLPWRLPVWMYPEYHEEKRRRAREAARLAGGSVGEVSRRPVVRRGLLGRIDRNILATKTVLAARESERNAYRGHHRADTPEEELPERGSGRAND